MGQVDRSSLRNAQPSYNKKKDDHYDEKKQRLNKILRIFWWAVGIGLVFVVIIFALIAYGKVGYMPPIEELENPKNKLATEVISSDGEMLSTYYYGGGGNRVPVSYNELSPYLVQALIATEDVRFKEHSGIDVKALFRAIVKRGLLFNKNAGGGSTITQQLAKQLYTPQAENVFQRLLQKPIEWVIAVQLERFYTKEEILAMYLNQYDFVNNAVGIKTAAAVYFGTTPDKLNLEQSATLIGMCKNASYYNPLRNSERSRQRRNVVLDQMRKADFISEATCDSAQALPMNIDFHRVDHKEGLAPYFREYLRQMLVKNKPSRSDYADWQEQQYRDDSLAWETNPLYGWCNKNTKEDGSNYNLYTDGLKIYTTIDSHMQRYAEEAVAEHIGGYLQGLFFKEKKGRSYAPYTKNLTSEQVMKILYKNVRQSERYRSLKNSGMSESEIKAVFNKPVEMSVFTYNGMKDTVMSPLDSIRYHKFFLRSGFMAMDPMNGHVMAYVGGVAFTPFQYDMVMTGRRQVGSTVKPFLYTMAMEEGFSPCNTVRNSPITITTEAGVPWTPRNANHNRVGEVVTLRWGLANSNNWISAYVMSHFTPYQFVRMLRSFGLNGQLDPVVSLCVGTCDATVAEMVSAYTSFANRGIRTKPMFVTRIEDKNGAIITHFSPQMSEIFSEKTSFKMLSMLRAVIDQGTGMRLRGRYGLRGEIGGKTGTTQNNSDGWFMGVTPRLVAGVWVGGEERDIHFDFTNEGQGANMALPIWGIFMKKVYADKQLGYSETDSFGVPPGFEYNCTGGEPAGDEDGAETSTSTFEDL
jgi:Membrane carboxypeptidase/penicillin-binding protein